MTDYIPPQTALNTVESITADLQNLGIVHGEKLLVHVSLSSMGWVNGGSTALIQALMNTLTEKGTLIMPAQSGDLSDPEEWEAPAVPKDWWQTIRDTMPAYDPATTPTRGIGTVAEHFRTFPGVVRSDHPAVSFAAWGKNASVLMADHALEFGLGESSPLATFYNENVRVLMIGCGFESCTAFHLGEYRAPGAKEIMKGAPIMKNGERQWVTYREIELDEERFDALGEVFEATAPVTTGTIGDASCKLFQLTDAVDASSHYFKDYRADTTHPNDRS
ncbi:aminoglycoside N(3)-acetyltransferase [Salisediminibacterium beveridgei]|uniref:Aminoglycoside N(3)-acetyltransferase n=1 Tax=Salisediminibacterium beveridgei TaxID=632773 RepID=A0A1D7QZ25_9BACI|nr:AAC(3) family N-acetyltransferase [Salisediminibacterium beveridgei]AOM84259.1 aminoglycoside N3-acetyltransferase [Salisediminibacterium beveridgei]